MGAKPRPRPLAIWITRDKEGSSDMLELWPPGVTPAVRYGIYHSDPSDQSGMVCPSAFEKVTGVRIEPGEAVLVEVKVKVIGRTDNSEGAQ